MKKIIKLILLFFIIAAPTMLFAQHEEPVLYNAFYSLNYIHKLDIEKDSIHKENMLLLIGHGASRFVSYDKLVQAKDAQKQIDEGINSYVGDGMPHIDLSLSKVILPEEIFRFEKDKKMFVKDNLLRNYLYEDEFPSIDWTINSETKEILGMQCQKATAGFKGRNWTVWFAPGLPFKTGPWKLGGLPGLILEAEDSEKEIVFQLTALESVTEKNDDLQGLIDEVQLITLPKEKIQKADKKTVNKLRKAAINNKPAFLQAQLKATGGFMDDNSISSRSWILTAKNPFEKD